MLDVDPPPFKRSGSERIKDGAKAILKRMESIKSKKKKKHSRDNLEISEPVVSIFSFVSFQLHNYNFFNCVFSTLNPNLKSLFFRSPLYSF